MGTSSKLSVQELTDGVRVDTGAIVLELTNDAAVRGLSAGGEAVIAGNASPLMAASLMESADYDSWRDYASGKTIEAANHVASHNFREDQGSFVASFGGELQFGGGDSLGYTLELTAQAGSPFVGTKVALRPQGRFTNRFLRSVELRLPLALNKRKRVVQAGDRGVQWNTRHWFQFMGQPGGGVLPEPDHNIVREFAIDQNTARDYEIWRSESTATSSLSMQRGVQAAGWIAAYDERRGLLFAYRDMPRRAPKSLRVMADGSGEAVVCLWHTGLPALDIHAPQAAAVFGDPHTVDWLPFTGEFTQVRPDRALATHWHVAFLPSDPPARQEVPGEAIDLLDAPAQPAQAPLVSGGVPLPKGALKDAGNVRLRREGTDLPLQTKVMAWWPDHSIKWLLLTFPADGGEAQRAIGKGDKLSFQLTRRDGPALQYVLDYGGSARLGQPSVPLTASKSGGAVAISTGPLQIEVAAERNWLRSVKFGGKELLPEGGRSFVDFVRNKGDYPVHTTHVQGQLDDGGFVPQSIELEEAGPLRAMVRLEGMTTAQEPTRVIARLEAYAGRSAVRVFQSAEFLQKDPRTVFVRRMGLELSLASAGGSVTVGGQDGPLALGEGTRAGIEQHSHLGYRAWHQVAGERFVRDDETKQRCRGWLDLSGPGGGAALMVRDMWEQFPNELMADVKGGRLVAYFWPEDAPVMDIRRYSNYPHLAQGESTSASSDWVEKDFYKNDAIVGISKTHELLLYFHGPQTSGEALDG
ncbi:MAG: hypothetical protein ABSD48_08055, partial [Armatimonadota bacterium]